MKIGQQLPFTVECKSSRPFFELIAAFDCRQAADGYAAECKASNPTFEYRVNNPIPALPNHDLADASDVAECMIVGRMIRDIIAAGLYVSVWDGEQMAQVETSDEKMIFDSLASTDQDILYIHKAYGDERPRFVSLVWGNGVDVISDYNTSLEDVLKGANELAQELDR